MDGCVSLGVTSPRVIRVRACVRLTFLLKAGASPLCGDHTLLPFVSDGQVGGLHAWLLRITLLQTRGCEYLSETLLSVLLGTHPEVELGLMRAFCVEAVRNGHIVSAPFSQADDHHGIFPPDSQWMTKRLALLYLTCFAQSLICDQLCDPVDCSPPGSSVHRVSQARILEG